MAKVKINSIPLKLLFYLSPIRFHVELGQGGNWCLTNFKDTGKHVFFTPTIFPYFLLYVNHVDHTDNKFHMRTLDTKVTFF